MQRRVAQSAETLAARTKNVTYVELDYPPSADPRPRYGHGTPSHAGLTEVIERDRGAIEGFVDVIAAHADRLAAIGAAADPDGPDPFWVNGWVPALDGASLYTLAASRPLRRYVEIGSGNSTKFVARARRDLGRDFTITSIDPHPRAEINALCDHVVRSPLETTDLSVFDGLQRGDVVFLDGSHRVFPNSDVAVFFLDVLPSLPAGVVVGIHDILLPDDYRPAQIDAAYSEQYMLATTLLAGGERYSTLLPCWWASTDPSCVARLSPLWQRATLRAAEHHGVAYWLETR